MFICIILILICWISSNYRMQLDVSGGVKSTILPTEMWWLKFKGLVIENMSWDQTFGSSTFGMCVSAHRAVGTPGVPVSALYHEHHICFDAVTNSSVTQPLPSQLTVQSCLSCSACHLPLMSCLFLKHETVDVYKNQKTECVVNIKNTNHVVCTSAKTGRSAH